MKPDRYFALLLRLLPPSFRERHGEELTALLARMKEDLGPRPGPLRLLRLYAAVTWDAVAEARGGEGGAASTGGPSIDGRCRELVSSAGQDLRYGARFMMRNKVFSAVAIGTLALGIGATTAIFSLLDATLLRKPAVRDPGSLVAVYTTGRRGEPRSSSSYPDYLDYRDRTSSLDDLAAISRNQVSLGGDGEAGTSLVRVEMVTGNYFALLGVTAAAGRVIQPVDDAAGAGASVAVLSWHLWQDRFGADPAVVGSTVRLNGWPLEVVGVASEAYRGLSLDGVPDLWVPMQTSASVVQLPSNTWTSRNTRLMERLIGRLAPGATVERARSELLAVSEGMREEDPAARGERSVNVDPIGRYLLPVGAEQDLSQFVWLLTAVVGATLLLACANLANLLLARASARRAEMGVRVAIGAGRARLFRQLLTESVLLSALGGAVGLIVALGLLRFLGAYELPGGLTISALDAGLHPRMLAMAVLLTVVTTALCGVAPAVRAMETRLGERVRSSGSRGGSRGWGRFRRALVAVQVGLCFVLLAGSGLFLRTLRSALGAELGFDEERLALASFNLQGVGYDATESHAFMEELRRRLEGNPRIEAVGVASNAPFASGGISLGTLGVAVEGYTPAPDEEMRAEIVFAAPGYFDALAVPVLEGRAFGDHDTEDAEHVVIVNRSMAERYWPDGSALGALLGLPGQLLAGGAGSRIRVVGVVPDLVWEGVGEAVENVMYLPRGQYLDSPAIALLGRVGVVVARAAGDPGLLLPLLREEAQSLEPGLSLRELSTMEGAIGAQLMPQRVGAVLLTSFGLLALLLASVGIVGVVSYSVREQRRAIGVRIALGAERGRIVRQAAQGMALPIGAGLGAGLAGALLLDGAVERFLYGVSAGDPMTYGTIATALAAITLGATLLPARRASSVDPLQVLKAE